MFVTRPCVNDNPVASNGWHPIGMITRWTDLAFNNAQTSRKLRLVSAMMILEQCTLCSNFLHHHRPHHRSRSLIGAGWYRAVAYFPHPLLLLSSLLRLHFHPMMGGRFRGVSECAAFLSEDVYGNDRQHSLKISLSTELSFPLRGKTSNDDLGSRFDIWSMILRCSIVIPLRLSFGRAWTYSDALQSLVDRRQYGDDNDKRLYIYARSR